MSGVSLALPPPPPAAAAAGGLMGSLRVIELQLVAFIMVFSASGLVPLLFPAAASLYILALSRFAFPSSSSHHVSNSNESSFFGLHVIIRTTVGLFLPLAYVLGGFARGDEHAVRLATPHLFLLSFQILTENLISGLSLFSPPVRALVPILYTARRLFVLLDWINDVWIDKTLPVNATLQVVVWHWFGRGLSIANMAYYSVNLFCFLIPRFLPRAFERYFQEIKDMEVHVKMVEDKMRSAPPQNSSDKKAN